MINTIIESKEMVTIPEVTQTFNYLNLYSVEINDELNYTKAIFNGGRIKVIFEGQENLDLPTDWTTEELIDLCITKLGAVKVV